ncbi:MAG TPA: META domain-containing protein [Pyrinomonadaceae bacterium]
MRYSHLFLLAVTLLTPVRFTAAATGAPRDVLAGTEWRLTSFVEAGAQSPLIEGTIINIKFSADGKVNGSGGCNSYGGAYRVHEENITLGRLISTKRACAAQAVTEQERRYLEALGSAGKFKLAGEQLTILYGEGRGSLHFVKTSAPGSSSQQQQEGAGASDVETEKELVRIIQSLMDAVAVGDKAVWERHVADDLIYTDENWRVLTKREILADFRPLPKGYTGSIRVAEVKSRINGDAAVVSWQAHEEETVYGQRLAPVYLVTDTYFRRGGRWQLVASQITVRPSERKPFAVDPKVYDSLTGEYELTSGVTYTVTVEGGRLLGQRTGREKQELLPADVNTYFVKGTVRGEKVFVRDAGGRVTMMLDRRENNDLAWKRIK